MRRAFGALALALVAACDRGASRTDGGADAPADASTDAPTDAAAPAWPALPSTAEAARALVERSTKRPASEARLAPIDATLVERLERALDVGAVVAGDGAIAAWVAARVKRSDDAGRASVVLVGGAHDARAQIEAFRRLAGPGAPAPFTHVVIEQLRADGHWAEVEPARQRGDDALLDAWNLHPSPETLAALSASQAREDYAAWKFGYLDAMTDLFVSTRAAGRALVACDMARDTQALLGDAREAWSARLRELHCALALGDALRSRAAPARVVALWGAEHVEPDAFPRFLPREIDVVTLRLVGGRTFVHDLEDAIARRFAVAAPLLFTTDDAGRDAIVVLPDPTAARRVEVVRARDPAFHARGAAEVASTARADVRIDGRSVDLGGGGRAVVALGAGAHVGVLGRAPPRLVFALPVPDGGGTDVAVSGGDVAITLHVPR